MDDISLPYLPAAAIHATQGAARHLSPVVRALMLLRYFVSARVSCARSLSTTASFLRSWPCRKAERQAGSGRSNGVGGGRTMYGAVLKPAGLAD